MRYVNKLLFARCYFNTGGDGTDTNPNPNPNPTPQKTFTQADLDRVAANERRQYEQKQAQVLKQLEDFKNAATTTQQQRDQLEQQIEEIKNTSMTEAQKAAREQESLKKKYTTELETKDGEIKTWRSRHDNLLINHTITAAAAAHDAFRPEQLLVLMKDKAKLVEEKDDQGQGTGNFQVLFRFEDTDAKTGKPITVDMNANDTLTRMKQLPELYGNLFKSTMQPGTGSGSNKTKVTGDGTPDFSKMSNEELKKWRATLH